MGRVLAREHAIVHGHHVGVVAHVTPVELRAKLIGHRRRERLRQPLHLARGAAHAPRALPGVARRARRPGAPRRIGTAITDAQTPGQVPWSPEARDAWEDLYLELALRRPYGLLGGDDRADRGADRPPGARVRPARPVAGHRRPAPARRARPMGLRRAVGGATSSATRPATATPTRSGSSSPTGRSSGRTRSGRSASGAPPSSSPRSRSSSRSASPSGRRRGSPARSGRRR